MNAPDLFGESAPSAPFKDIRNQRESVADEKARLCSELNAMLRSTPTSRSIETVQKAREFKHAHKQALKVLQSRASSRQELSSAISSVSSFYGRTAA